MVVKDVMISAIKNTESVYGVELGVTAAEKDIKEGDVMVPLVDHSTLVVNAYWNQQVT